MLNLNTVPAQYRPLLIDLFHEATSTLEDAGFAHITQDVDIMVSGRMSKALGKVECKGFFGTFYDMKLKLQKRLVEQALEDEGIKHDLLEVIIHELIHVMYPDENHGHRFQYACRCVHQVRNDLKIETTYNAETHNYQPKEKEAKYILKCPKCGNEWHYQRMNDKVRYPHFFSCGKCHEPLVRVK